MLAKNIFLKTAVLLLFISSISCFVAYRSGYFNKDVQFDNDDDIEIGVLATNDYISTDTSIKPNQKKAKAPRTMMPSSKVVIMPDIPANKMTKQEMGSVIMKAKKDSILYKADSLKPKEIMFSTKSAYVVRPYQVKPVDSISKKKKKKNLNNEQ